MGIPIIIVLISLVFQTEALIAVDDRGQSTLFQTGQPFDAQLIGPIESGDSFGVGGMLPALGLPLLGLLLLLGLTGGATGTVSPTTPCPPCPVIPTTPCPPVCNPVPTCPMGFERLGSPTTTLMKCYRVTATGLNFAQAAAACYAMGGTLVEFDSAAEAVAVQAFVNGLGTGGSFLTGYNDLATPDPGPFAFTGTTSGNAPAVAIPGIPPATAAGQCVQLNAGGAATAVPCATAIVSAVCQARIDLAAVRCVCA